MAGKKKNTKKNSNYQKTYKYVSIDQLCRKTLCDFRNMEPPKEELGEKKEVDQNLYDTAVELCCAADIITAEEKAQMFDGKNHEGVSPEEVSRFTGIPLHQIEKNLFSFKLKTEEDHKRAGYIKMALCTIISSMIQEAADQEKELTDDEKRKAVGYINFCALIGLISDEESSLLYFPVKLNQPLEMPVIASVTGLDPDTIRIMQKG